MITPAEGNRVSNEHTLSQALLIYSSKRQYTESRTPSFVTTHDIQHEPGAAPALGAGRLLHADDLRRLVETISGDEGMEYLQPNILSSGILGVAWHTRAQERRMVFATNDEFLTSISGQNYPQPPLLYVSSGRQVQIYALNSDERPTLDAPLFNAPYFNVFGDHRVCLGTMPMPNSLTPASVNLVEDAFFNSSFTHATRPDLLKGWTGSYGQFWQHTQELGMFPTEHLVPANLTLKDVLS